MRFASSFFTPLQAAIILACLACNTTASAADEGGMIEVGALHHTLTAGFQGWNDQFVRGTLNTGGGNWWSADLVRATRFDDSGTLVAVGHTRQFGERWYGSAGIATSSGGFFFPSLRLDLVANRKWGEQQKLITTVGLTSFNAKDGHRDRSVLLAMTYYFDLPLILQTGIRINRSNPGAVVSRAKYVGLTYHKPQRHMVSVLHSFGREAYQLIGPDALLVGLDSTVDTLTWRQWVRPRQGIQLRLEKYRTPFYSRQGAELALFQEF